MAYTTDLTAELANWITGLLREMLIDAPPANQRNTVEWVLERLDAAGSALGGGGSPGSDTGSDTGSDPLAEEEVA